MTVLQSALKFIDPKFIKPQRIHKSQPRALAFTNGTLGFWQIPPFPLLNIRYRTCWVPSGVGIFGWWVDGYENVATHSWTEVNPTLALVSFPISLSAFLCSWDLCRKTHPPGWYVLQLLAGLGKYIPILGSRALFFGTVVWLLVFLWFRGIRLVHSFYVDVGHWVPTCKSLSCKRSSWRYVRLGSVP